jgi:hypothetical protein
MGSATVSTCHAWVNVFGFPRSVLDPRTGCTGTLLPANKLLGNAADPPWAYDPETNPRGARCTLQDFQAAVFGVDPDTGFALRPWDNVGVQYGLEALLAGRITTEQFVDLNEKVGGLDVDYDHTTTRTEANEVALERAYRTGRVVHGRELARVPIMDLRGSSNFEIHTDYHTWSMRDRLVRDNGHAHNHVHWLNPGPAIEPPIPLDSFLLVDRWLTDVEADDSGDPLETKVVRHKPTDAVDACYVRGDKHTNWQLCALLFPSYGDARMAAGGPRTGDVLKCELKDLDFGDYPLPVVFTPFQQERLAAVFPDGVCDWTRPGVAQQAPQPWMSFAHGPGGRPLGPPPTSILLPADV